MSPNPFPSRYLSAFHASRKTSVCKKPYNPILGEIFRCCYYIDQQEGEDGAAAAAKQQPRRFFFQHEKEVPTSYPEEEMAKHGPIPYASDDCVVFLAEQVICLESLMLTENIMT